MDTAGSSGGSHSAPQDAAPPTGPAVYDVDSNDPDGRLIDRAHFSKEEIAQISAVMQALGELREAENRLRDASLEYMKLGQTDMRAIHFLIVAENSGQVATASALAVHLGISSASTTKLVDRLERGGHLTRSPHPTDRRAQVLRITQETRKSAMETVGAQHARRFHSAARLSADEREVVIRFLLDMAQELGSGDLDWSPR
ncbi:MarR family transcriptional regulator [Brevibacterium daeguense]|uniref:MarR family transcriptional regulator n=1 Tax=Brevibacterium daeguense TaxID=909936 RepID=A0ABP8EFB8_9MICO